MSEETAKSVTRRFFDALNGGDLEGATACLGEEVTLDLDGKREIGRDRARWTLAMRGRNFREHYGDLVILDGHDGSRAAAECTVQGTYLASAEGFPPAEGQHYSIPAGFFFEIDDGLLSRVTEYRDREGWIRQLSAG